MVQSPPRAPKISQLVHMLLSYDCVYMNVNWIDLFCRALTMVCDIWTDRLSGLFLSQVLKYSTLSLGDSLFWKQQDWRRGPILFPKHSVLYCNTHDCKHQTVYGFKSIQPLMNLRWYMCRNMYVNAPNMPVQAPMLGLTRHEMNTPYIHVSPSFMVIYPIVININNM